MTLCFGVWKAGIPYVFHSLCKDDLATLLVILLGLHFASSTSKLRFVHHGSRSKEGPSYVSTRNTSPRRMLRDDSTGANNMLGIDWRPFFFLTPAKNSET